MKKVVVYDHDTVVKMVSLLNDLTVTGIEQARTMAAIAQLIDTGQERVQHDPPKEKGEGRS